MGVADTRDILVRLLGEETVSKMAGRAETGLDHFGDSLEATERDAKDLDRQIGEVERSLALLSVAFARAQDAADKTDISRAMRKQQADLRKLTKAKDLLPDFDAAGAGAGIQFVKSFAPAVRGALSSGPGAAIGAAAAAAVVPILSAAVAGGIVGGVGLGGVVGGLKLASQDSRVQAAGKALGETVMGDLEDSATRFVRPTIQGIGIIRGAWEDVADEVDGVFAATSRYVEPLARGISDAVRELAPGLRKAAESAGPVIREISVGLPRIGRAFGDLLSTFADDADEGASAIRFLFMLVEDGVHGVALAVHGFSALYRVLLDVGTAGAAVADTLYGWVPGLGDQVESGRKKLDELKTAMDEGGDSGQTAGEKIIDGLMRIGDAADTSSDKVRTWADVLRESIDQAIASENANIRLEQSIDDVAKAAKEGADKGIDRGTEAGRRNRLALLGLADAANAASEKILANTGSHELAAESTERARKKFLAAADAMGVEKGEAIALANKLFGIPNISRSISVNDKQALAAISRVQQSLGKIKDIHRGIYYTVKGDLKLPGGTSIKGAASGGPVTGPGPKGVDSKLMMLAPGEHVLTAAEVDAAGGHAGVERIRALLRGGPGATAAAASTSWGPSGGGGQQQAFTVRLEVGAGGTSPDRAFASMFLGLVRTGAIRLVVNNGQVRPA